MSTPKQKIQCLCFDLTHLTSSNQFIILALAVFFFHCFQGFMHELIFRLPGFKPFSMYFTLVQFALYATYAFLDLIRKEGFNCFKSRRITLQTYLIIAFLTVATMALSNTSVAYLNYTTFCMFKSCKLIPVMLGSVLIIGKKYTFIDKLSVLSMTLGLIFFTLADSKVSPNFEIYGVVLVCCALLADAVIGNVQEAKMKAFKASNTEMIVYSYSIGCVYILIWELIVFDRIFQAVKFCSEFPIETYGYIVLYSTAGYLGLNMVLTLVTTFGALTAVTVTTLRKAVTICFSFILFSKPFTIEYFFSGMLVVLGIYLNMYSKNKRSWNDFFVRIYNYYCRNNKNKNSTERFTV